MTPEKPDPAALLPCPWCGCKPEKLSVTEGSTFRWRLVECPECGAGPGEIRMQTMGAGTKDEWEAKAHVDAIAAWNTRAALPPQTTTHSADDAALLLAFQAAAIDAYTQHDGPSELDIKREQLRAAVLSRMSGVPEGYVVVPKVPTEEMIYAGHKGAHPSETYAAMLAAAPTHPVPHVPEWRDIKEAKKDGTIIWARFHPAIFPFVEPRRKDLERWNGLQICLRHPGMTPDGFDPGWNVAAPVGHGGFPDEWIAG